MGAFFVSAFSLAGQAAVLAVRAVPVFAVVAEADRSLAGGVLVRAALPHVSGGLPARLDVVRVRVEPAARAVAAALLRVLLVPAPQHEDLLSAGVGERDVAVAPGFRAHAILRAFPRVPCMGAGREAGRENEHCKYCFQTLPLSLWFTAKTKARGV